MILLLFVQLISFALTAQKERIRGIYKTSEDFIKGYLSFDNSCNNKRIKAKLNDFFCLSYITIKQPDKKEKIYKRDVFGYLNCKGDLFRFNRKQQLLLLNVGEQILIYKHIVSKPPLGKTNVTNYYFSLGIGSPAQKLTIKNVKNAFPGNIPFHTLIDENFKYNTELAIFDETNKIYKINWLLKKS